MLVRLPKARRIAAVCGAVALTALAWVFAAGPVVTRYHLSRAEAAMAVGEVRDALGHLQSAQSWDADSAEVQIRLARAYRRLGEFDRMNQHLAEARRLGWPSAKILAERWLAAAQIGRVDDVARHLPRLLTQTQDEDRRQVYSAYVTGYSLNLNFAAADVLLDAWVAEYPDDPEPEFRRGDRWYTHGRWEWAVDAYRAGLKKGPDWFAPRLRLAECLLKTRQLDASEREFRRCLEQQPDDIDALLGLATCMLDRGDSDDARGLLEAVLRRDPDNFEARLHLGHLELVGRRGEQALRWLQPLAEKWPEDWELSMLMIQALHATGQDDAAQRFVEIARDRDQQISRLEELFDEIRKRPHDLELRYQIGRMLVRHRSRAEGVGWLQSVLRYDPQHRGAHAALAEYYENIDRPEDAARHRMAAELDHPSKLTPDAHGRSADST